MSPPRTLVLLTGLMAAVPAVTGLAERQGAPSAKGLDGRGASRADSHVKAATLEGVEDAWVAIAPRRAAEALESLARHREASGAGSAAIVCLEDLTAAASRMPSRPSGGSANEAGVK